MLRAKNRSGQIVNALYALKEESHYCPLCNKPLKLKRGEFRIPHFAHLAEVKCTYRTQESKQHLRMKDFFCKNLLDALYIKELRLETPIQNYIADIFLIDTFNRKIVIECLCSNQKIQELKEKIKHYTSLDIFTLFVLGCKDFLNNSLINLLIKGIKLLEYQAKIIEKILYKWQGGRLYYFIEDKLFPIRFQKIRRLYLKNRFKPSVKFLKNKVKIIPGKPLKKLEFCFMQIEGLKFARFKDDDAWS